MTFREWAEGYCVERGLSAGQAREVIDRAVEDQCNTLMRTLWDEEVAGNPTPLLAALARGIDRHALDWIDEHQPDAPHRGWFVEPE